MCYVCPLSLERWLFFVRMEELCVNFIRYGWNNALFLNPDGGTICYFHL
jgi:hypothetical protein